jgi:hypothetical protein
MAEVAVSNREEGTREDDVADDGSVAGDERVAAIVVVVVDQGRECGYQDDKKIRRSCRSLRDFSTSHDLKKAHNLTFSRLKKCLLASINAP